MKIVCPSCRDPAVEVSRGGPFFPFCSRDCQDRDLVGWVFEGHRIATDPSDPLSVAPDLPPRDESGLGD